MPNLIAWQPHELCNYKVCHSTMSQERGQPDGGGVIPECTNTWTPTTMWDNNRHLNGSTSFQSVLSAVDVSLSVNATGRPDWQRSCCWTGWRPWQNSTKMVDITQMLSSSQQMCYIFSVTQTPDITKLILQNCPLFSRKRAFLVYLVYFNIREVHYLYFCFIYLLASSCSFSLLYISNTVRKKIGLKKPLLNYLFHFKKTQNTCYLKTSRKKPNQEAKASMLRLHSSSQPSSDCCFS